MLKVFGETMSEIKKSKPTAPLNLYDPARHAGVNSVWLRNARTRETIDEVIWWHNAMAARDGVGVQITLGDVMGPSRVKAIARVRHDIMRRLRHKLGWSLTRIGVLLGRDHTSVIHAVSGNRRDRGARASLKSYHQWLETKFLLARRAGTTRAQTVYEFEYELEDIRRRADDERAREQATKELKREIEQAERTLRVAQQRLEKLAGASNAAQ